MNKVMIKFIYFILVCFGVKLFAFNGIIKSSDISSYISKIEIEDFDNRIEFTMDEFDTWGNSQIADVFGYNRKFIKNIKKCLLKVFQNKSDYMISISKQLKHPLFRENIFVLVDTSRTLRIGLSRPRFVIAINDNKNRYIRFQRYEYENADVVFDWIKREDIKMFNKLLAEENVSIGSYEDAFDICMFFVNIARQSMRARLIYSLDSIDDNDKLILKDNFYKPKYEEYADRFSLSFYCIGFTIQEWKVNVYKKGKIELISVNAVKQT